MALPSHGATLVPRDEAALTTNSTTPTSATPPTMPSMAALLAPAEAALVPIAIGAAVTLGGVALVVSGVKLMATIALTLVMVLLILLGIWWLFSPRAWLRRAARRLGIPRLLTALAIGGLSGVALSLVISGIAHGRYVHSHEDRFNRALDREDWNGARSELVWIADAGRADDLHDELDVKYRAEHGLHLKQLAYQDARDRFEAGDYSGAASGWHDLGEFRDSAARYAEANEQAVMRSAVARAKRLVAARRFGSAAKLVIEAERSITVTSDWSGPFVQRYAAQVERRVGNLMRRGKYRSAGDAWATAQTSIPSSDTMTNALVSTGERLIAADTRNTSRALAQARQQLKVQSFDSARRVVKRELPDAIDPSRLRAMLTSIDESQRKWNERQARIEAQRQAEASRRAAEQAAAGAYDDYSDYDTDMSGNWCGASRDGDGDGVWCE